jgi:tetratricopeptide (TPR) repeat protein
MAKSPFHVQSKPLTQADELRSQLDELEARVGRLGYGLGKDALTIPALFDSVTTSLASFKARGQHMRAEETRLGTVSARLSQKANVFLREIGGADVLEDARPAYQPDPEHWWWFLDQVAAERRRASLWRLLKMVIGVMAVLLLLFALYQRFLAPDPITRERLRHQYSAENLAMQGDVAGALSEAEQALAIAPDDPALLVLKGVLQQRLEEDTSVETFAAAERAFKDDEAFLLARAQAYLLVDQPEAALSDARSAIEVNPGSAAGYMALGRAYEQLEDYPEAILAYEQVIDLAEKQGDFQLSGMARINAGLLRQRLQTQPIE